MLRIGFELKREGELQYFTIPLFENTGLVRHCFTTKNGGVSSGECATLNLGFKRKDKRENVIKNFEIICNALGINKDDLVFSDQVHGDNVRIVTDEDRGKGIVRESDIIGVDSLITNARGVPLVTFFADCVPIFFLDYKNGVIALAHAGWRGTLKEIAKKTVDEMVKNFSTNPKYLLCAIGPSIGCCCYEVGNDLFEAFKNSFTYWRSILKKGKDEKYLFNLWIANYLQLLEMGVRKENVVVSGLCTSCNPNLFYSHRRDKGQTGSLAAIMGIYD